MSLWLLQRMQERGRGNDWAGTSIRGRGGGGCHFGSGAEGGHPRVNRNRLSRRGMEKRRRKEHQKRKKNTHEQKRHFDLK